MENDQEFRHSCKFCKKRFSCGRALGGHMRSHITVNSAETEEKLQKKKLVIGGNNNTSYAGFEESANSGYGLRENPKKTWRLSDSSDSSVFRQVNKVCKDCGKGFQSLKALFGHMRCHSDRFSRSLEDDSWSEEQQHQQQILDSQSDNEGAPKKRRSRRTTATRYGIGTSSFSVSDEQQEQEEQEHLAMCLMMLSRGVGFWGDGIGRGIVAESSDNNSVSVDVRSGSDKGVVVEAVKNKSLNGVSDRGLKIRKHELDVSDNKVLRYEVKKLKNVVSDDGVGRVELKKSKSDVSDTQFQKEYGVSGADFVADESGFEVSATELGENSLKKTRIDSSDVELGRNSRRKTRIVSSDTELDRDSTKKTRFDCSEIELRNDSHKKTEFDGFDLASRKKNQYDLSDPELRRDSYRRSKLDASDTVLGKDHYKRSRYECTTCNKIFHSYQALGGHRASHKKVKGCFARIETSENSIETDLSPDQGTSMGNDKIKSCKIDTLIERGGSNGETNCGLKKIKIHECPICFRVFSSGQALGGHKRSHMAPVGNSETKDGACQAIVIHQKMPEISDLLDLNLPAPIDGEVHSHIGLKSWWVENSQKHDQLGDDPETPFAVDKSLKAAENNLVSSKHTDFRSLTTPPRPCLQV